MQLQRIDLPLQCSLNADSLNLVFTRSPTASAPARKHTIHSGTDWHRPLHWRENRPPDIALRPIEAWRLVSREHMSWLWEKSRTWRRIVATTKQSRLAMAGFTVVACAVPYYAGKLVLYVSNSILLHLTQSSTRLQRDTLVCTLPILQLLTRCCACLRGW